MDRKTYPVLDARAGHVPHPCAGTWDYKGLNAGGHEIYYCDRCRSTLIGPHVNADHVCHPDKCTELWTPPATR